MIAVCVLFPRDTLDKEMSVKDKRLGLLFSLFFGGDEGEGLIDVIVVTITWWQMKENAQLKLTVKTTEKM